MSAEQRPLVVISHSREDGEWLEWMRTQLDVLAQYDHIEVWDDRQIAAGEDKFFALDEQLGRATIAICLISVHYLASPFIRKQEVNFLLERRQRDGLLLVPILVGPCAWQAVPWLKRLRLIPSDGKPIPTGSEQEILAEAACFIFEYASALSAGTPEAGLTVRGAGSRDEITEAAEYAFDVVATSKGASPAAPTPVAADIKVDIQRLPVTGYKLFGRDRELELLDDAWESESTHVIALIAWGGVGKSTLVNNWLDHLETDDYRGARRVYGWSFHSQGTGEQVTSADYFFDEALRWFGAREFEQLSAWDKGELLARLVRAEKTLLLLDGLEPLQSGSEFDRGTIKDPGLKTLLAELIRQNDGLCVVTSRQWLAGFADPGEAMSTIDLERISPEAGRSLLRVGRVRGSDRELEQATREFGGHALAIHLLAAYVHEIEGHDIVARSKIPDLDIPEEKGRHPRRVIMAIEALLGEGPEIELLRVLGLFDRSTPIAEIHAVADASPIDRLTTHLHGLSDEQWNQVLSRLRKLGLIAVPSDHRAVSVEAHPLVREHFAAWLGEQREEARLAHSRLFDHLRISAPDRPDNVQDMMPLFSAMAHGCLAGRYQEAIDMYYSRIQRDGRANYSMTVLGLVGTELAALAGFFRRQWDQPTSHISDADQTWVLGVTSFRLMALGRLAEAAQPMSVALAQGVAQALAGGVVQEKGLVQEEWTNNASRAVNLTELYLLLGDVSAAMALAEQSMELADRGGDASSRIYSRAKVAQALHQSGRRAEALAAFREAEAMQEEFEPERPRLYSWWGFHFCELLLDELWFQAVRPAEGERRPGDRLEGVIAGCREVRDRAEYSLAIARSDGTLKPIAVSHLTLGRARVLQAHLESRMPDRDGGAGFESAGHDLDEGVLNFRKSQRQVDLPRGLLARAALSRIRRRFDDVELDLVEAERIAERSSMLILQIDEAMERAWLNFAMGDPDGTRKSLDHARRLIRQTEKPYRPHRPDWRDWHPSAYVGVFEPGEIIGYHRRNREIALLEEALSADFAESP